MKPSFIILLLGVLTAPTAMAQRIVGGFLSGGYATLPNVHALSEAVLEYPGTPSARYGTAGCELFYRTQRAVFSLNVTGMGKHGVAPDGSESSITGSTRHLKVGWIVKQTKRYALYPSLGPGLTTISFNERTPTTDQLRHFYQYTSDVGISADVVLHQSPASPDRTGQLLMLGIRVGCLWSWQPQFYERDISSSSWQFTAMGRPAGFYASLTLGGGAVFK